MSWTPVSTRTGMPRPYVNHLLWGWLNFFLILSPFSSQMFRPTARALKFGEGIESCETVLFIRKRNARCPSSCPRLSFRLKY